MMKEEERGELFQGFQEQLLMHHQYHQMQQNGLIFPPEVSPILQPWQTTSNFNPFSNPDPFLPPLPPPSSYASFFNRSSSRNNPCLQFPYHELASSNNLGIGQMNQPFGIQGEIISKMTAQEIMDAKALAASKSHSEAERRRRERINNHLAKLRSLLPSTTKTDKASLLAEVIQHVKELKRQTTLIADISPLPTELDELSVDVDASDEDGKFVIKASLCCEDRTDLLPQIIKALKSLRLRTLKAEITTLGGRVKNVLFITGDDDDSGSGGGGDQQEAQQQQYCISSIQEALKAVMEKVCGEDQSSSGSIKRQRTNHNINIIENRSL